MSFRISIDGGDYQLAKNVVVYDENGVPIAAVVDVGGGGVMFADAARDRHDLRSILAALGELETMQQISKGPEISGNIA